MIANLEASTAFEAEALGDSNPPGMAEVIGICLQEAA